MLVTKRYKDIPLKKYWPNDSFVPFFETMQGITINGGEIWLAWIKFFVREQVII